MNVRKHIKANQKTHCKINVIMEGRLKVAFLQDIYRKKDKKLILKGKIIAVVLDNGKPILPENYLLSNK